MGIDMTKKVSQISYKGNSLKLASKLPALASGKCVSLTAEDLDGVTSIGYSAFAQNMNIIDVTIPNTVKTISDSAFSGNYHLVRITIGNGVKKIGSSAFSSCQNLIEIYNLSSLPLTIGSSEMGEVARFVKVIHTSLDEPSVLTRQGDHILYAEDNDIYYVTYTGDSDSVVIPNNVTKIYRYSFYENSVARKIKEVTIPNGVTSIEESAFAYCSGLTSITIPSSVTSIGNYAFNSCDRLIEVYNLSSLPIAIGATTYGRIAQYAKVIHTSASEPSVLSTDDDGHTIATIGNDIYYVGYNGSSENIVIPSNVTQIFQCACRFNDINSVTIPSNVTVIGDRAFLCCSNLKFVTIGSGVTSIGQRAFADCGLTSITINATTPPTLSSSAFTNTNNCPIYVPAGSVTAYKTATNWSSLASRIQAIP